MDLILQRNSNPIHYQMNPSIQFIEFHSQSVEFELIKFQQLHLSIFKSSNDPMALKYGNEIKVYVKQNYSCVSSKER